MRVTPYTTDAGGGRRAALSSGSAAQSGETGRGVLQRATPKPWGKPTAYGCNDSDGWCRCGQLEFLLRLKRLSARWSGGERDTTLGPRGGVGRAPLLVRIDPILDEDRLAERASAGSRTGDRGGSRVGTAGGAWELIGAAPHTKLAGTRLVMLVRLVSVASRLCRTPTTLR